MLERQKEEIACAKQKGVYKWRRAISRPDNWQEVYQTYTTRQISGNEAMKRLDLKRIPFYNFVKAEKAV